ncbi:MAG TPA: magnesium transporter [Gemmatimonadaceae bacterium]|jgi:magnesium transporter|nr:magnesium transporter [Gemmatimonadaceae bacterium]
MIEAHSPELLYLLSGDPAELAEMLSSMRPVDVAEALSRLQPDAAAQLIKALPFDLVVQVFDEPELEGRAEIFQKIDAASAAPLLEAMSADQQADLFRELTPSERDRLAKPLDAPTRQSLALLLRYPPEVAGGIMTTEAVTVPSDWSVEKTLQYIVSVGGAKETVYTIYVLDGQQRMVHVVSLRQLMLADRNQKVLEVGPQRVPLSVKPTTDREDVARLLSKYNLLAVPVVDDDGKLLGIVTVDDVIDAIVRETTEDVQKFGGMEALDEPYMEISMWSMIKKRAGWLCALFLGEMLTATAMGYFEGEISKAVVLALFIPLIISSGGNSGSQATSLIIRAMALREVTLRDWWRVASRELPSGIVLGLILGVIGFVRIMVWQRFGWYDYGTHHTLVAITVASALVGVVTFGSLAGSMLPFVLRRFNFDPASASAPFVATLVDVTGLIIYFSVAFVILRGTLL